MNSNLEMLWLKNKNKQRVQAMVESINNGMTPQGSATPDSNCSAEVQGVPVERKQVGQQQVGTSSLPTHT